jgi:hypothetical protein
MAAFVLLILMCVIFTIAGAVEAVVRRGNKIR